MPGWIAKLPQSLQQMAIYGAALILTKLMSLLMVPVFTHFLEPEDYGRLDVLQTLANLISIIIAFGLSDSLFRFCGEARNKQKMKTTAAEIFGLAIVIGIASLVITQLLAPTISNALPAGVSETQVRLILGSLAFSGAILVPMSWLRMNNKAIGYTLASAGCAIAQATLSALLLYLGYGIEGVLISGLLCMSLLAVILFLYQIRNTGIRLRIKCYPRYGHFGGVLAFAGFSAFIIDSFPRWILAGSVGPAEMATFALAAKLAIIVGFLSQPFEMWWMPRRFSVLSQSDGLEACARGAESGVVIAMLAAILVSASAPAVVTLLTPESYHGAIIYVPALAVFMALNAIVRLINIGCLSKEQPLWPMIIDGTAAAFACIGYFILIPIFGAWGLVAVTAIAMSGQVLAYLIIGHKIKPIPYAYIKLLVIISISTATCIGLTMVSDRLTSLAFGIAAAIVLISSAFCLRLLPVPRYMRQILKDHIKQSGRPLPMGEK